MAKIRGKTWGELLGDGSVTWDSVLQDSTTWYNDYYNDKSTSNAALNVESTKKTATYMSSTKSESSYSATATRKDYSITMENNLPDYYKNSEDIEKIIKMCVSELVELSEKEQIIEATISPFYSTTSTIELWEKELKLTTDKSLPFIFRRNIASAYYFAIYNDCTHNNIIRMLEIVGCKDIFVKVDVSGTVGVSVSINSNYLIEITKLLKMYLPAHLELSFTTAWTWQKVNDTYSTWNDLLTSGKTWADLLNL